MTVCVVVGIESERNLVGERAGIVVCVGAGNAVALAAKIEAAIASGATHVISVGICGALDPLLPVGAVVIGESVCGGETIIPCDPAWAYRLWAALHSYVAPVAFPVSRARFAWSPSIVGTVAEKAAMRAATAADVIDEETFVAAQVARAHGLPFAALRAVSDTASQALPQAALTSLTAAGGVSIGGVLASIDGDPAQLPVLMRLGGSTDLAFASLGLALAAVGDSLCAYPETA